ncbi:lytic transglycosylase domain-containing protein [Paraburkholderia oxyphila]|uniref:lytic transglycosylase domain-containing protein n=1 Tax=Paraburkholderia oxyphila TaxID=614212 RepID=UPI00047F02E4|nr:transglycosylase SLT domain-containing protein [Paraburkholderia oxyphila]
MQYRKSASLRHYLPIWLPASLVQAAMLCAVPSTARADCIDDAASFQHVNVSLMRAIAQVESGTQTHAVNTNSDGTVDIGLMQINSSWLPRLAREGISEQSLFDPCTNAYVGAWILAENIRQYGPTWSAIGAYNASSPDKRLAYARKVYATAQSITRSPDSPMPILPPSYVPPEGYNPFATLQVNQVKMNTPHGAQATPASAPGTPAISSAAPGAYNFGWIMSGADAAKPVQVFDDGTRVYVQFSDMKHVPAIFAETPRGRVVLRWEAQPPYAVIASPERKLVFQIGSAEAIAQKTSAGAATGTTTAQSPAADQSAAPKTAATRGASSVSTDALWYVTASSPGKAPAASLPAPQANVGTAQTAPAGAQQTAQTTQAASTSPTPAPKPQASAPGTSALWYVTK